MFFTEQDYRKIKAWLDTQSVKDSALPEGRIPFTGSEELAMLQDGKNVRLNIIKALNTLMPFRSSDFINISNVDGFNTIYSLEEAIHKVLPVNRRKGAIITFTNEKNMWVTYQFRSDNKNNWDDLSYWKVFETDNPYKGFFEDFNTLNSVYPNPKQGDYAYVGPVFEKAFVYRCNKTESRWEKIGPVVAGYRYIGITDPYGNSLNEDNLLYVALEKGTYVNFGGLQVNDGITLLKKVDAKSGWIKDELFVLTQTTGNSTTEVMSQKAVTDNLNTKVNIVDYEDNKETVSNTLQEHRNDINKNKEKISENFNAIIRNQEQIDALSNRSDVVDVVKDYASLDRYDISTITINDIIKVLRDETKNNSITYYKLVIYNQSNPNRWKFIGALGEYYTKAESDAYRQETQNKLDEKFDKAEAIIAEDWDTTVQDADKSLLNDALRKTPQDLTENEKQIARNNIGVTALINALEARIAALEAAK